MSAVSNCCSHEPSEWPEAPGQANPYHIVQAPDSAAAPRAAGGQRAHQGLRKLSSTSFQETRLQKLPEHLSSFCHSSSVQYSVSVSVERSCMAEGRNTSRFRERKCAQLPLLMGGELCPSSWGCHGLALPRVWRKGSDANGV